MTPTEKLLAEQEKVVAERGYYIRPVRMANLMKAASRIEVIYPDGSRAQYVAEDCGGAIKAQRLDVFFADHQTAREYGVRTAYVFLVQEGDSNE